MIKEHDFIEIEYTGKTADDGMVFDTTSAEVAKTVGMHDARTKYSPAIICVGEGQILKGIDNQLLGKEVGKEYTLTIPAEEAFGKKSAKFIQLISTSKFLKQKVQPMPGLQVNIDGNTGIIKTVTGGRTMVDFNHPLASKDLVYDIKVLRLVADDVEKAGSIMKLIMPDAEVSVQDGSLKVTSKMKLPEEIQKRIGERITKLIPTITKTEFTAK